MADRLLTYRDRIVTDPDILAGKPVVRGTRIPVDLVLEYLARNPNLGDLYADYPRLTPADVQACFAYAHALVRKEGKRKASLRLEPPRQAAV